MRLPRAALAAGLAVLAVFLPPPVEAQAPQKLRHAQNRLQGVQHELSSALGKSGEAGGTSDEGPTSPEWEIAHNDDGSLTGPSY